MGPSSHWVSCRDYLDSRPCARGNPGDRYLSSGAEQQRLDEARANGAPWKKWGPYLSERQWGTVREDYSDNGDAWNYFTHDQARSRAYRWGEDGLGGIRDDHQVLCFALALWNGRDPIIKERAFGLANSEGNHGEDVKEYYFYLDSTPTHSYMKYLYKYPQAAFPYDDLVAPTAAGGKHEPEYELLDTGIFDDNRYFDVFVEYAKAAPDDVLVRITRVQPRRRDGVACSYLPTLWFRNTWSQAGGGSKPILRPDRRPATARRSQAHHTDPLFQESLPDYYLYCDGDVPLLFTENETNNARLFGTGECLSLCEGRHQQLHRARRRAAVNPAQRGTKVAAHYTRSKLRAGSTRVVQLRLTAGAPARRGPALRRFRCGVRGAARRRPTRFYESVTPPRCARTRTAPTSCARRWRACCGPSSTSTTTSTCGSTNTARARTCRRTSAGGCATASGRTCTTTTSSRCRTSGNTRGTRPGTWHST